VERVEGHESMDEEQISDEGITTGHGTFVAHTGDVRGHRSVTKQHMSTGKVTEDTLMSRIDTYDVVSPTKEKNVVWCYMCNSLGGAVLTIRHGRITDFQGHGLNFEFEIFHSITVKQASNELWKKCEFTLTLKWRDSFVTNGCVTRLTVRQ
jgi:hypothetical protein